MRKRLTFGLAAGLLAAAMMPGVASATPGNPDIANFGGCKVDGGARGITGPLQGNLDKSTLHGPIKLVPDRWTIIMGCV